VAISVYNPEDLGSFDLFIKYDPSVLTPGVADSVQEGTAVSSDTMIEFNPTYKANEVGVGLIAPYGIASNGSLVIIPFTANPSATNGSSLSFDASLDYVGDVTGIKNITGDFTFNDGSINITPAVTVTGVTNPSVVDVVFGTPASGLNLPSTVQISLSNGASPTVGVTWNTTGYNGNVAGTYYLSGALTLPGGVTDPDNMAASAEVVVGAQVIVPVVSGISTDLGPIDGGTTVTITGTGFTSDATVSFGSTAATITNISSDGTTITATSPVVTNEGQVDITVTTTGGTSATSPADQFTYFMYGDVNGDGNVNAADAVLVLQAYARLITLTSAQKTAAEVNGDSTVNAVEAVLILQYYARLIKQFPVQ